MESVENKEDDQKRFSSADVGEDLRFCLLVKLNVLT